MPLLCLGYINYLINYHEKQYKYRQLYVKGKYLDFFIIMKYIIIVNRNYGEPTRARLWFELV
jgi:hypothetical protein